MVAGVKIAGTKLILQGAEDFVKGLEQAAKAQADFNAQISKQVDIKLDTTRLTADAEKLKSIFDVPGLMKFPAPELDTAQWNRVADILKDTSTEAVDFQQKFTRAVKIAKAEASDMGDTAAITAEQLGKLSTALLGLGTASATMLVGFGMVASRIEELNSILTVTAKNAAELASQDAILAEQMGDVVAQEHALATAAALTSGEVQKEVEAVRALHLSGIVANEAVAQMIRYDLDWTRASELAREAQDAATYAMQDSSVAMNGLIQGIITLQPRLLRTYGIMINLDIAYEKWATANNKSVKEMSVAERQQAALNEVLAKAPSIAGAYEAAMGAASKQVRSLKTDTTDFAEAMGKSVTPILDTAVGGFRDVLHAVVELPAPIRDTAVQMTALGSAGAILIGGLGKLVPVLAGLSAATLGWGAALTLVGAGIGYLVYLNKLEEAHRDEAAAVAASSTTYEDYKLRLEEAKLKSYELTEQLWDQVKAQDAVNQAEFAGELSKALDDLIGQARVYAQYTSKGGLWGKSLAGVPEASRWLDEFIKTGNLATITLTEIQKEVLKSSNAIYEWGRALGISEEQLPTWVASVQASLAIIRDHDEAVMLGSNAIKKFGDQADGASMPINTLAEYIKALAAKAGLSAEEVTYLKDVMGLTDDEVVSLGDSLNLTNKELVDLAIQANVSAEYLLYLRDTMGYTEAQIRGLIKAQDDMTAAQEKFTESMADLDDDYNDKARDLAADRAKELAKIDQELAELHGDVLGEMSDLDEEYAQKREDAYQDMVQALEDADRELAQDIEDAQRDLQQNLEDADRDYQQDLVDAARERLQDLEDLEREYAQDLADAERERNQDILDADMEFAQDQEELLEELNQDLLDIAEEYAQKRLDIQAELASDLEELERDHADKMADIDKQYQEDSAKAAEGYAKDVANIYRSMVAEITGVLKEYQRIIEGRGPEASFEERRSALERRLRALGTSDETKEEREAIIAELKKLAQEEVNAIKARYAAQQKARKKQYNDEQSDLRKKYKEEQDEELSAYEKKRQQILAQYEQDLSDLEIQLALELEARRGKYAEELAELIAAHDEQLAEIQRAYEQRLAEMLIQHEREHEEIERDYQQKLEDLRIQHEREREEILRDYQQKLEDLQRQHAQEEAEIQRRYAQKLEELAIQLERERAEKIALLEKERQEVQAKYAEQAADLQKWYNDRYEDIVREYGRQRAKIGEEIRAINKEASTEFGNLPAALQPTYVKMLEDAKLAMDAWKQTILGAIQEIQNALQMGSPSKVMMDIGKNIMDGLVLGLGSVDVGKELDAIMGKEAMSMNVQAAMMGQTMMPAAAQSLVNNRNVNNNLSITAQYQKVQSETSLRDDLALYNMMMRQQVQ